MASGVDTGQYELKCLIGQGAFGKVFLLENPAGEKLALKVCELHGRSPKEVMQTIQEVKLLASLQHKYILRYVLATQEADKLTIITEFCCNGDLQEFINEHQGTAMDERRLVEWIRQITEALKYLHGLPTPIIHRDLKSANIFLDENWDAKLGDFGIARILTSTDALAMTQCGTPFYMSPEIFQGIPYSSKTDIYSLGVMMYEMAHMDKGAILPQILLFKIVHQTLPAMPTNYSDGIILLLTSMLKKDPAQRPSASQILEQPIFKTTKKPPKLPPRGESSTDDDADVDDETRTIVGTLTQLEDFKLGIKTTMSGGGAARIMEETTIDEGPADEDVDNFNDNPVLEHVARTLVDMGLNQSVKLSGRSTLDRNADMLKMYCIECLDNNKVLFNRACKALDSDQDEDEIEETLIRILGHEKYGLCGLQLLHYKNFTFNLRP